MTCTKSKLHCAALSGAALVIGAALTTGAQAQDKELRIGLIVPTTGILAQVGKDMVDGFNLYLEEANNDFAGAKVKLIVEDDRQARHRRHQGQEAHPAGQGPHAGRRRAGHRRATRWRR